MSSVGAGGAKAHHSAGGASDEVDYGDATGEYAEDYTHQEEGGATTTTNDDDADLAALEAELEEAEEATDALSGAIASTTKTAEEIQREKQRLEEERNARDERSIFVSGLDWNWTGADLSNFFSTCGAVARATVRVDKYGQPKGMAYVEFESKDAVANALILDGTENEGRKLHIVQKRTNVPSFHYQQGGRGGRGGRGGPRGGGGGGGMRGSSGGMRGGGGRGGGGYVPMMLPAFMAAGMGGGMMMYPGMGGGMMMGGGRGGWRGSPRGAPRGGWRGSPRGAPRGRGGGSA